MVVCVRVLRGDRAPCRDDLHRRPCPRWSAASRDLEHRRVRRQDRRVAARHGEQHPLRRSAGVDDLRHARRRRRQSFRWHEQPRRPRAALPVDPRFGLPARVSRNRRRICLAALQRKAADRPRPRLAADGRLLDAASQGQSPVVRQQPLRGAVPRYLHEGFIYVATGEDPDHGEGEGSPIPIRPSSGNASPATRTATARSISKNRCTARSVRPSSPRGCW